VSGQLLSPTALTPPKFAIMYFTQEAGQALRTFWDIWRNDGSWSYRNPSPSSVSSWSYIYRIDVYLRFTSKKGAKIRNSLTYVRFEVFTTVTMKMASSGRLRRVTLVRSNVSEERSASFIRVTRIGEIGTTLDVTSNRRTLRRKCASVASYS
jgi:hypothetical protein